MYVKQLRSRKIPANQFYWQVIKLGKTLYLANVTLDFESKSWQISMTDFETGEVVLHSKSNQRPADNELTTVFLQRARELDGQESHLLGVDFEKYFAHAKATADESVKNPQRFIITVGKFGSWAGTLSALLDDEATYQRTVDYLNGHGLLDSNSHDDDYPKMGDIFQAMTMDALNAACDGEQVYTTSFEGDLIGELESLQATINAYDGTEREVATTYQNQIVTQLVDDTDNIDLVVALTGLTEQEVLECLRQAH